MDQRRNRRLDSSCCHQWLIHKGKVSTPLLGGLHSRVQQRKRAGVQFLSGVFSRRKRVSGRIDGSNGNIFDSTVSEKSLAEAKRTCSDILRLPGGTRESIKSTAVSHSNQVMALGHIGEYFDELHKSVLHAGILTC